MFRDPGTTGPHRLKKRKDRSALVPVLALLVGQRALPERARARVPESGHHARPPDRLGHEEGGHPPCGHLVQPARSVMTARGRPARRLTAGFLCFGLPVLAAGRHWGPPVGSSSFALSLPTGPQAPFSDKRRAFSGPFEGRIWRSGGWVPGPSFGRSFGRPFGESWSAVFGARARA